MITFTRNLCQSRFKPLTATTLDHIHFRGITPFEEGEKVQKMLLQANLDFKRLETTIARKRKEAHLQGYVLNEQEETIISQIMRDRPKPTLLTFEFSSVYTGGKQMKRHPDKIKQYQSLAPYHQLERGGKVTWHGPGQLVAYPILDLRQFSSLTPKCFVDSVMIQSVQNLAKNRFGLETIRKDDPGVFMSNGNKIASIGCNIQHGITSYGVSVNLAPDLKYLNTFEMCGSAETKATSVYEQVGKRENVDEVASSYARELANMLNLDVRSIQADARQETERSRRNREPE